jgi:hypothetical protein
MLVKHRGHALERVGVRVRYSIMSALTLFLTALDFLLALILLDAEWEDEPRRRLERVEARRRALRGDDGDSDSGR